MSPFSADEIATLRAHGLVSFADRLIFDAQPPMPEARLRELAALCEGPLPADLLALWRTTAGGRLAYSVTLEMSGQQEAFSWTELFFDGSRGYRDLDGWVDHELELAEESAPKKWSGRLRALPIGGFEYLDRVYVDTVSGEVLAWKQGLPPAWTHRLHEDAVAVLGKSLTEAFAALHLTEDPRAPQSDSSSASELLEYLDERVAQHGLSSALRDAVVDVYARAQLKWEPALEQGSLAQQPRLAQLALLDAIRTDDASLLAKLEFAGVSFNGPLRGSARPLEVAVLQGAFAAATFFAPRTKPLPARLLGSTDAVPPPAFVATLQKLGVVADLDELVHLAMIGATEALALLRPKVVEVGKLQHLKDGRLVKVRDDLKQVRSGKLGHFLGEAGLAERVANLERFDPKRW